MHHVSSPSSLFFCFLKKTKAQPNLKTTTRRMSRHGVRDMVLLSTQPMVVRTRKTTGRLQRTQKPPSRGRNAAGLCLTIREGWRSTPAVFLSLGRSLVLNCMLTCAITMTHTRDHEGLYASVVSRWKPNRIFSFGYGRVEILCGYTNAVLLTITCTNTNQKPKRYPISISL